MEETFGKVPHRALVVYDITGADSRVELPTRGDVLETFPPYGTIGLHLVKALKTQLSEED